MAIINRIAAFVEDMRAWRHDIHQHPELAYEEHRTGGRVAELLREFGVDEMHFNRVVAPGRERAKRAIEQGTRVAAAL